MATNNIQVQEEQHLSDTLYKVREGKESLERVLESLGAATLGRLAELRNENESGPDLFFFMEQLQEKHRAFDVKGKYSRLREFEFMLDQPYFARIDIIDPDTHKNRELYIGKFGYTLNEPIITDWRTKVASLYYRYRYPQKEVEYETPSGLKITDLLLKRTFEIDHGLLNKYFNNDIQLDESEIIIEKIKGRTGGVLEDIIETIQMSQLDIIESDPRQVCIVQGCVGSGKSTVAIHKLAHIFFNYDELIRPNKSILIAKNQILVSYLSTLFPKLGIFDIQYKTIRELIVNIVFREELGLNIELDIDEDTGAVSITRLREINKKIQKVHDDMENAIDEIFTESPEFELFGGYRYSSESTPFENISDVVADLTEEIVMQKENIKLNPNSTQAWMQKENLKTLRKLIRKLNAIKQDIRAKVFLALTKGEGLDKTKKVGYRDALLYLYLYSEIVGIKKYPMFEYCVVDEGQDFSPLEYAFLSKVVLRGRFAILGDLNQSLESDGITSWDDITEVIKEAKHASTFELDTNYRSTKPIIDYANHILSPYTDKYLPKSINRKGEEPTVTIVDSNEKILSEFETYIKEEIKEINKSIGVICMNDEILNLAHEKLSTLNIPDKKYIKLDPNMAINYIPKGVYLMHMDDCKGLEFAKVYILGLNPNKLTSLNMAREAFVAITRAMNELGIIGLR